MVNYYLGEDFAFPKKENPYLRYTHRIIDVLGSARLGSACWLLLSWLFLQSTPKSSIPRSLVEDMLVAKDYANLSDGYLENVQVLKGTDNDQSMVNNIPSQLQSFETIESAAAIHNGTLSVQSENSSRNLEILGAHLSTREIDSCSVSGVKRPRMTVDEKQPSVHVIYTSLTKDSKRKLEELLQEWSQWNLHNCPPSNDSNVLQSGEETYFPALRIDLDKSSAVAFWVDDEMKNPSSKELMPLDGMSVPVYDREYSLALTSADVSSSLDGGQSLDTSRCFNCGSYSHALRDCPKPRDNVAVNNARKQHKSAKRNQHSGSRNSTRYYQDSRVKKYDGLVPGSLDAETRKLLGLGEFDPPPWLNRMREIGYPPAYIEPEEEDQPSGITIFGDDTTKEELEDGEILGASYKKLFTKLSVEFPGINSPIPEKADERLWAPCYSSSSRSRRRSRDIEDGPPGCDPGMSPSLSNHFCRYVDHDSQVSPSMSWSSTFGRSLSNRGRRSPFDRDNGSSNHDRYGTY
ncbi:uncharacterized protein [Primulina huaijiensis]|uniref:uncharacterized protein isoform X3 n=1 Tax=Primulina huaijiensis TaxID=1492673 RepID=UPI003CC7649F